ncbi:MAG: insulinase family protein [Thermoanaerobaculia bacterium]|nr:insulinase family protein [Thermoanaerobaculia bacterium]
MSSAEPSTWPPGLPPLLPAERPGVKEAVHVDTLSNGVSVWVVRRPGLPLVSLGLACLGGKRDDPHALPGLSALLAEGLKEGSETLTAEALHERLQGEGAALGASAGADGLSLSIHGLADGLDTFVDILSQLVRSPAFPEEGIARVRALAEEDLATQESEPSFLAVRVLLRALFADHPYATVAPSMSTISAVSPGVLRGEAKRRFRPDRTAVIAVGDVDPGAVLKASERFLGGWEHDALPETPVEGPEVGRFSRRILAVERPGSVQTYLMVGNPAVSRNHPDFFALSLAMTAYGGAFTSRLVTNLRTQKGYTYSPGARLAAFRYSGYVRTVSAVRNEVTGAALNEIFYELDRMGAIELSDEELERSRMRDVGLRATNLQTSSGLFSELMSLFSSGLGAGKLDEPSEKLFTIQRDEIKRASKRHLASYATTVVAVGDLGVIEEHLAPFGPIEVAAAPEPGFAGT